MRRETQVGRSTDVALNSRLSKETEAALRAILQASDHGVLMTDLDHNALACNRRFGEIWNVSIDEVVRSGVGALRKLVRPLLADPAAWEHNLDQVYGDPQREYRDELPLSTDPPSVVRRYTGPVLGSDGEVMGRLWTFLDVTQEVRLRHMREILNDVALFYSDDPQDVYGRIVGAIRKVYPGSTAILSLLQGDWMKFLALSTPLSGAEEVPGNALGRSYCQFALRQNGPLQIPDANADPAYECVNARELGLTRYLGVPLYDSSRTPIGTLCLIDAGSGQPLDDEDERFLSLLAMRASSEVLRVRHLGERMAGQRREVERQGMHLDSTQRVLGAMNAAFELIGVEMPLDELVGRQVGLLKGVLGHDGAALMLIEPDGSLRLAVASQLVEEGATLYTRGIDPDPAIIEFLRAKPQPGSRLTLDAEAELLPGLLVDRGVALALDLGEGTHGVLALYSSGSAKSAPVLDEAHLAAHLEAIAEQVSLLVSTHLLRAELRATRDRLSQSEKLSVVGTLAAATAHDIRNILSSLSFELSYGLDQPESALAAVRNHLDRFQVLAHRLLSYAKPRMVARQPVTLASVLDRVVALTSAHLRVADVQLVYDPGGQAFEVAGDSHQLEHLFVNLVLNAVQAMNRGGVLAIELDREQGFVVARVSDSGVGIPTDRLALLFEPFASTRPDGFGLGLYSCKRIAAEHGGRIEAKSTPGRGTTFSIWLPLHGRSATNRRKAPSAGAKRSMD